MSLDGNNKDIFREGVIKQTFHFTTMTFQISHLIAFLNIWYKGQILYLTINKAETHTGTFQRIAIFSFLAAWHTPHSACRLYLQNGEILFAPRPNVWLEERGCLTKVAATRNCCIHYLPAGRRTVQVYMLAVQCTVYCTVHTTFPPPGSWLAAAGCTVQSFSLQSGSNTSRPQLHSHIGHTG